MPQPTPREIGEHHQAGLDRRQRKTTGVFYTPEALIDWVLDHTLEPVLDEVVAAASDDEDLVRRLLRLAVCDPSCGTGLFLLAAADRIISRGAELADVLQNCIFGVDLDPGAIGLARQALPGAQLEVGNALVGAPLSYADRDEADAWCAAYTPTAPFHWRLELPAVFARGGFDVVIGNPPFLNRLETATALRRGEADLVRALVGDLGPYTDVSAIFLRRCLDLVRPGGRLGMVQPMSLLSARDAAPVRAQVAGSASLTGIWASAQPAFADASVLTCAVSLARDGVQAEVQVHVGGESPVSRPAGDLEGGWGHLIAPGFGIPAVALSTAAGSLGDLAECTADFRDQYYGLEPFVHEATSHPDGIPLLTSGLIEPARSEWGQRQTRFLKRVWEAPVIDRSILADPGLGAWAHKRLVPKILVATQGRVIEAVADLDGRWLPSVPVLTVTPGPGQMWRVLAVLMAPPVVAHAAAAYLGSALAIKAIKLSARQLAALPLPVDHDPWQRAAGLLARAGPDPGPATLIEVGALMCAAYDADTALLEWWVERARF